MEMKLTTGEHLKELSLTKKYSCFFCTKKTRVLEPSDYSVLVDR